MRKSTGSCSRARRAIARAPIATIATTNPDGSPHAAVVWYALGESTITINSSEGRHWPANLRRDPRIAFTVEQGYDYVTVLGRVTIDDDPERSQRNIAEIAARYITKPEALAARLAEFRKGKRIIFKIHPTSVLAHGVPAERRAAERGAE